MKESYTNNGRDDDDGGREEKRKHLNVWFAVGLMVWVHRKTAKTTSSTTSALMGVGS